MQRAVITREEEDFAGHFVVVPFDVSVKENSKRDALRDELYGEGFARQTQSVYICAYSKEALAAAERIVKKYGLELMVTTPTYESEKQREWVRSEYETAFAKNFDRIVYLLQGTQTALDLADESGLGLDDKQRKKFMTRLNAIAHDTEKMESALRRRREREPGIDLTHLLNQITLCRSLLGELVSRVRA